MNDPFSPTWARDMRYDHRAQRRYKLEKCFEEMKGGKLWTLTQIAFLLKMTCDQARAILPEPEKQGISKWGKPYYLWSTKTVIATLDANGRLLSQIEEEKLLRSVSKG